MKPIEALWDAIMYGTFGCVDPRKPGAIIERLPKKVREDLSKLTSDETKNTRIDWNDK